MKEQTQEKTSHPPGTESCAATGQPARRSVDRKTTGRNRKVKELSPERTRRGRRGFTYSRRPHDGTRQRRASCQPTGIGDHGKGSMDSRRNLGGPTASLEETGRGKPVNKLPVLAAAWCAARATRTAPWTRVGKARTTEACTDGRLGVSLVHSTKEVG